MPKIETNDEVECRSCHGPKPPGEEEFIQCNRCYRYALQISSAEDAVNFMWCTPTGLHLKSAIADLPEQLLFLAAIYGIKVNVLGPGEHLKLKPKKVTVYDVLNELKSNDLEGAMNALLNVVGDDTSSSPCTQCGVKHGPDTNYAHYDRKERILTFTAATTADQARLGYLCAVFTLYEYGGVDAVAKALYTIQRFRVEFVMDAFGGRKAFDAFDEETQLHLIRDRIISGPSLSQWDDYLAEAITARLGLNPECSADRLRDISKDTFDFVNHVLNRTTAQVAAIQKDVVTE